MDFEAAAHGAVGGLGGKQIIIERSDVGENGLGLGAVFPVIEAREGGLDFLVIGVEGFGAVVGLGCVGGVGGSEAEEVGVGLLGVGADAIQGGGVERGEGGVVRGALAGGGPFGEGLRAGVGQGLESGVPILDVLLVGIDFQHAAGFEQFEFGFGVTEFHRAERTVRMLLMRGLASVTWPAQ